MMHTTYAGGYYYRGKTAVVHSTRSNPTRFVRVLVLSALVFFSILFGAMMHAYATNGEQTDGTSSSLNSTVSMQAVSNSVLPVEPAYEPYIVERGDSLWLIAKQYLPAHLDIRDYIGEIKAMNQLDSAMIYEGQLLQIPIIH